MTARPQRTCIACRQVRDKADLVRLVRAVDGRATIDRTGTAAGRGAYACPTEACLGKAFAAGRLAHALKASSQPPSESVAEILEHRRRR